MMGADAGCAAVLLDRFEGLSSATMEEPVHSLAHGDVFRGAGRAGDGGPLRCVAVARAAPLGGVSALGRRVSRFVRVFGLGPLRAGGSRVVLRTDGPEPQRRKILVAIRERLASGPPARNAGAP